MVIDNLPVKAAQVDKEYSKDKHLASVLTLVQHQRQIEGVLRVLVGLS